MSIRKAHPPLAAALLDLCRSGSMKLTVEALMMSGDEVMKTLTGRPAPTDPVARGALARWIVATVHRCTEAFDDTRDRGIAQVALPTDEALHGLNIGQRIKRLVDRHVFTPNQYWKHRPRVVAEIAASLQLEYPAFRDRPAVSPSGRIPTVFLAGYQSDDEFRSDESLAPVARALGIALSRLPVLVNVCSMASRIVMTAGYTFAEQDDSRSLDAAERYMLYRRNGSRRPQPFIRYLGRTECLPGNLNEARVIILERSDVVIAIGGGTGTAHEMRLADQLGKPVIPIAATGGAAGDYHDCSVGRVPSVIAADYRDLANPVSDISLPAAGRVVTHFLRGQR